MRCCVWMDSGTSSFAVCFSAVSHVSQVPFSRNALATCSSCMAFDLLAFAREAIRTYTGCNLL
jgi:hypothetical protein